MQRREDASYDVCVIGAGSGGVRAARTAAQLGARVCIVEQHALGGTCVNLGCIPKKLLVYASEYHDSFDDAHNYGWNVSEPSFSWPRLIEHKNREIGRLNDLYATLLHDAGIDVVFGRARLHDHHTVCVEQRMLKAKYIVIATGSHAQRLSIPGAEHAIVSDDAFHLGALPSRVLIAGGGYIGCEFASIFTGMGARVIQAVRSDRVLRDFDHDISRILAEEKQKRGIDQWFGTEVVRMEKITDGIKAVLSDQREVIVDSVLLAVGRTANTANLGLEELGVERCEQGRIRVDPYGKSSVESIYAIGDVSNEFGVTPVAIHEGIAVAHTLVGSSPQKVDRSNVPTAVFSIPSVGSVGLSEEQARSCVERVEVYRAEFRPLRHTLSGRDERSMVKLIVDAKSDRVLGCHMVGPDAGEVIQGFATALKAGATKRCFDDTIGIHPTLAEEFVTLREPVSPT